MSASPGTGPCLQTGKRSERAVWDGSLQREMWSASWSGQAAWFSSKRWASLKQVLGFSSVRRRPRLRMRGLVLPAQQSNATHAPTCKAQVIISQHTHLCIQRGMAACGCKTPTGQTGRRWAGWRCRGRKKAGKLLSRHLDTSTGPLPAVTAPPHSIGGHVASPAY